MRTIFILIAMVFSIGIASAQNTRANANTDVAVTYDLDTITNAGTVTQNLMKDNKALAYPFSYQINIVPDSLSGATAATLYVEHQANTRTNWVPLSTTVIDGGLTYAPLTGSVLGGKIRVRAVGTGTQSTKLATDCTVYRATK